MTLRPCTLHDTFVITRRFRKPVERLFQAWSSSEAKRAWFSCHADALSSDYSMDFRAGGREINKVVFADGVEHRMEATFIDIVPNARIIYAYEMLVGDSKITVSLATVEFLAHGDGSTMTFTEQLIYLDNLSDPAERRRGTEIGLDNLVLALADDIGG